MRSSPARLAISAISLLVALRPALADQGGSLEGSIRQLRFSPDGKYVLTQTDSEIAIITVRPFAVLFSIPAKHSLDGRFTPDSKQVVFIKATTPVNSQISGNRYASVERWNIGDRMRLESTKLPYLECRTEELSPDGNMLVCLDFQSTLRIVEVKTGQILFEKRRFTQLFVADLDSGASITWGQLGIANFSFSPDSRYVVIMPDWGVGKALAWNLEEKTTIPLVAGLKQLRSQWSAFLAPDRMLVSYPRTPSRYVKRGILTARMVQFPSGLLIAEPKIPMGTFYSAADPNFAIIRPFGRSDYLGNSSSRRSAAVDLRTGIVVISDTLALDVFGDRYIAEPFEGQVGLYEIGMGLQATLNLNKSR